MPQTYCDRVEGYISRIIEKFKENPEIFLTESDVKCRLFMELSGDSIFSLEETTRDQTKKTNYVHSETSYFVLGKLNKRRVDITVVKPSNYDFSKKEVVFRKGYYFSGPSIGIELKLNKTKTKKNMEKEVEAVLNDLELLKATRPESNFYLLFLDKRGVFNQTEICAWQNKYPNIKVFYGTTADI
jgi:hypothetical protein